LTETTVNTLGHINVVSGGTTTTVRPLFSLNCDGLSWTNGFAQFTSDTTFLTAWIAAQSMLTTEPRAEWSLFEWVINGGWLFEDVSKCNGMTPK
jgi:hypothetical protein